MSEELFTEGWLTPQEYADRYSISVILVYRHLTTGRIEGAIKQPNGYWKIPPHAPDSRLYSFRWLQKGEENEN